MSKLSNLSFDEIIIPTGIATTIVVSLALLAIWVVGRRRSDVSARHWISRLMYGLFVAAVTVLAATSLGSILLYGHMAHYALLSHVAIAGAFVFLLLGITITYLPKGAATKQNWWWEKWSVWGVVVSGILVSATMFLSMVPVLDTAELIQILQLHRFTGLATVVFTVLHLFSLVVGRLGWR